jgi:hypothetical protein
MLVKHCCWLWQLMDVGDSLLWVVTVMVVGEALLLVVAANECWWCIVVGCGS